MLFTPTRVTTEVSPGSGLDVPVTGAVPLQYRSSRIPDSPGSGISGGSWRSSDPGTPDTLTRSVLKEYRPDKEDLQKYSSRIIRQAQALTTFGCPLHEGVLE